MGVDFNPILVDQLEGGEEHSWFWDDIKHPDRVRWFMAVPLVGGGKLVSPGQPTVGFEFEHDMAVEVTRVFYISKGINHQVDGTGGEDTLQLNIVIRNLFPDVRAYYILYEAVQT